MPVVRELASGDHSWPWGLGSDEYRSVLSRARRMVGRARRRAELVIGQLVIAASRRRTLADSRLARALFPRLPNRPLPVFWYRRVVNFGDLLSPAIVAHISGCDPVYVDGGCRGKLLALGSILQLARPGDIVWGSGSIENGPLDGRGIRFLAVRGPLTRALVQGDVPEVYGDPAILLPQIYQPKPTRRFEVGVVAHYKEQDVMFTGDPAVAEINVMSLDWRGVVDRIAGCDVIISSSLHGIIVAEAYGIPTVWVHPTHRKRGGKFKFRDYFAATGRQRRPADWGAGIHKLVECAEPPVSMDPQPLIDAWRPFA